MTSSAPIRPSGLLARPLNLLAFGFGAGLSPVAPGTAGTVLGVIVYWPLSSLPLEWYLAGTFLLFALGIPICGGCARDLGVHDHPGIVWDEVVGFLVTMIAVPNHWLWIVAGFALFRIFDILKPWPIRLIDQQVRGGIGIMLDDILAGLYALALLQLGVAALRYL